MSYIYSNLVSRIGLPLTSVFTGSQFWKIYKRFENNQEVFDSNSTSKKLNDLLRHAYSEVSFYKDRLEEINKNDKEAIEVLFSQIKPLTKQDIVQNFPDRITSRTKVFPPWRYASTSGTLERMTVIHDFRKRDYIRAAQLYAMSLSTKYKPGYRYLEIPPDICSNVCGVSDSVESGLFDYLMESVRSKSLFEKETISTIKGLVERQVIYRRLQLSSFSGNGFVQKKEDMDSYLNTIQSYKPYAVKALPVYLFILARHILKNKKNAKPISKSVLMPMGASLTSKMKSTVEEGFGVQVYEDYGSAELGSIGAECCERAGIHIFEGLFKVEVVRHGHPAKPGEVGRVLVTDLYNYAMPLIRYDIGDVAVIHSGTCDCGRDGLRLEIKGRLKDCLFGKDDQLITGDDITDLMLNEPDVAAFQIEARNNRINLAVLPDDGASCELKLIEATLKNAVSDRYRIRSRIVSTIMPEASGKYRFVKNLDQDINEAL